MISKILNRAAHIYLDSRSWKTKRKFVVFESDDWGSIRISSKESYAKLLNYGVRMDKDAYCKYDSLENSTDLAALFEVLQQHKDQHNHPAVFTANTIVANPDFEKIKNSAFERYYFENVQDTFKNYYGNDHCLELWKQGREAKVFHNQFHGREHLNVERWMSNLKAGNPETLFAFNLGIFGISTTISNEKRKSYMAAFDADANGEIIQQKEVVRQGLDIFEKMFNYRSESFIAPNFTWSPDLEETLHQCGVKYLQGNRVQKIPNLKGGKIKTQIHYTGQTNKSGQIYLTRSCGFEPSYDQNKDWISSTLTALEKSFKQERPAIISSHRLNYVGNIDENNRNKNLEKLNELLTKITKQWPEVEFVTSDVLGKIISEKQ